MILAVVRDGELRATELIYLLLMMVKRVLNLSR